MTALGMYLVFTACLVQTNQVVVMTCNQESVGHKYLIAASFEKKTSRIC